MPTEDFIIELFCLVDDKMLKATKHSQAGLLSLAGKQLAAFLSQLAAPDPAVSFV